MAGTLVLTVCLLVTGAVYHAAAKHGDYITPCSLKDPQLNQCVATRAQALLPHLLKGVKEWGLVPLDPLKVPLMQLENGGSNSFGLSFNLSDSTQFGYKDIRFTSAKVDPKLWHFELKWKAPKITTVGDYQVRGMILRIPLLGKGHSNFTTLNNEVVLRLKTSPVVRGRETYLQLNDVKVNLEIEKIHLRLDNLFGSKEISEEMNVFLNKNSKEAFTSLQPGLETIFGELYYSLLDHLFNNVPLNQLFTDTEGNFQTT